jgi:hypothetical protein
VSAARRIAIVVTPVVAIATMALGLRVGARSTIHAAVVRGAPKARGATAFAWQLVTLIEDRGVRETEPLRGVTVRARTADGREATWTGDTNADGVAEVRLEMPGVDRGTPMDLDVTAPGLAEPLAHGPVAWGEAAWKDGDTGAFVRPARREGAIAIDVAVVGARLVAQSPVSLAVRTTAKDDGHAVGSVTLTADPEPGLDVTPATATTCPLGWARLTASPVMHVASLGLHARTADGRTGDWFAPLPVAMGGIVAVLDAPAKAGEPIAMHLRAAASHAAYVEVDDDRGRAFAASVDLALSPLGPQAAVGAPPMAPGLAWVVTSGEPRGAETLAGAALARPFLVDGAPPPPGVPPASDACAELAYLSVHPAAGFARFVAVDGFAGRAAGIAARRKKGLAIALGSLAVASLLEVLLLLGAAARARADALRTADLAGDEAIARSEGAGGVLVGVLVALLGFGLLAAMLLWRS